MLKSISRSSSSLSGCKSIAELLVAVSYFLSGTRRWSYSDSAKYGEWENCKTCTCGYAHFKAYRIYLGETYMTNDFNRGVANVGRGLLAVLTFGLSTTVNGGVKDLTHDYVEVWFKCCECDHKFPITFDYGDNGKQAEVGYYTRYVRIRRQTNINLTYKEVIDNYSDMISGGSSYSLTDFNCSHWAGRFYNWLT